MVSQEITDDWHFHRGAEECSVSYEVHTKAPSWNGPREEKAVDFGGPQDAQEDSFTIGSLPRTVETLNVFQWMRNDSSCA